MAFKCQHTPSHQDFCELPGTTDLPKRWYISTKKTFQGEKKEKQHITDRCHFFFMLYSHTDFEDFVHLTLNASFSIPKAELNVVDINSIQYKSDIYVLSYDSAYSLICIWFVVAPSCCTVS